MLQGLGRAPANPNQGQQMGLSPAVTLLQDDILELADISPGDLTEACSSLEQAIAESESAVNAICHHAGRPARGQT